jgi:isopenicillin N synthase-like dioxygenase
LKLNARQFAVGDILDRMTGGRYVSAKHRAVCPELGTSRLSVPFFFDPGWNAKIREFPLGHLDPLSAEQLEQAHERWEKNTTFAKLTGIWAQYLAKKVEKVFKDLPSSDFEGNKAASTRFAIVVPTHISAK